MPARLIDGKAIAEERRARLADQVAALQARGIQPCLAAVSVHVDAGWSVYLKNQAAACARVGIRHQVVRVDPQATQEDLSEVIEELNVDTRVHGIILQSPLRRFVQGQTPVGDGLSDFLAQVLLSPDKDVEGVSPSNLGMVLAGKPALAPCTAVAAVELAKAAAHDLGRDLRGMEAVVVGASTIVGKPVAQLLLAGGATVTVCHIDTRDLASHTTKADLIIVAVGKPGLLKPGHVRPGAIVIDVGINRVPGLEGKSVIVGDVAPEVAEVAAALTPVPGGVGALTTTILLEATANAADRLADLRPAVDGAALGRVLGGPGLDLSPDVADRIANLLSRHLVGAPGNRPLRSALERRLAKGVLVLDGAMGSELIARGVAPAAIARANLGHPDLVQDVHQAYVAAGAEALTTNTFGVNRYRLQGDRELVARLAAAGVRLARLAAQGAKQRVFVLGSIGPLGPVVGADLTSSEAEEAFGEVAMALADAGVDGYIVETMPSTAEAVAALGGIRRASRLPALVCRSIDRDDPAELADFARAAAAAGATAVGINCAAGPRALVPVVARLAQVSSLPVVARPNAGFPTRVEGVPRYHLRPDYLVTQARAYVAAGASLVGGCCGVGPDHIAAVSRALAGAPLPVRAEFSESLWVRDQGVAATPAVVAPALLAMPFPILAFVPGRLSPAAGGHALQRLADAGADAVGLLTGWPGSGRGARLPARLRHLQDVTIRPAVLELIAADTTLPAAQELLLTAHLVGVRTVIIDDGVFSSETRADVTAAGCEAAALLRAVKTLNQGRDLGGTRLEEPTAFTVGVRLSAARARSLGDAGIDETYVRAGTDFLTLQPVYQPAEFRALMGAITPRVPLLAEILVLPDAATADELDNELPALSVPERLKSRLSSDPDEDAKGVLRFLSAWRARLGGVCLLLPDERTRQAEAVIRALRR
jgi:5,10-methylene-tetrahydrofolate dehydrogenase/methenyl tetrahydrofolate cyclohydrolase/methionine synthase I (cobalamin-dependent)/5,10-methylenetetrahydrofolate reductase